MEFLSSPLSDLRLKGLVVGIFLTLPRKAHLRVEIEVTKVALTHHHLIYKKDNFVFS